MCTRPTALTSYITRKTHSTPMRPASLLLMVISPHCLCTQALPANYTNLQAMLVLCFGPRGAPPAPPQRPHFSWYHQPFPWRKTHLPLHCTASPPECHPYRLTAASELRSGGRGGGASYPTSGVFPQAPPRQAQLRARRNPGVPGGFSFGGKAKTGKEAGRGLIFCLQHTK